MKTEIDDEIRELAEQFIRLHVAMGFEDADDIHGAALDYLEKECDFDALEPYLYQLTRQLLTEHIATQKMWPAETDCDRLDFAFLTLEEDYGIIARQNFTCCQTCGHTEIWDEVRAAQVAGHEIKGYVFYHQQDTENAAQHGDLCIAFGALETGDEAELAIARCAVQVLHDNGLDVVWNGNVRSRPMVRLNWQKRRPISKW